MPIYEVKKFGVTLVMGVSLRDTEECFKKAHPGEVAMYQIVNGKKLLLRRK